MHGRLPLVREASARVGKYSSTAVLVLAWTPSESNSDVALLPSYKTYMPYYITTPPDPPDLCCVLLAHESAGRANHDRKGQAGRQSN